MPDTKRLPTELLAGVLAGVIAFGGIFYIAFTAPPGMRPAEPPAEPAGANVQFGPTVGPRYNVGRGRFEVGPTLHPGPHIGF